MSKLNIIVILLCSMIPNPAYSSDIYLNQMGYLPGMKKVAVYGFSDTKRASMFKGTNKLYIVDILSGKKVQELNCNSWEDGKRDTMSGDYVYHIDFSSFDELGHYKIVDYVNKVESKSFKITKGNNYKNILKDALKTFYYQRCGIEKTGHFSDASCHSKDLTCWPLLGEQPTRDLHGGWHDAGDYNKYVCYVYPGIQKLLSMYATAPDFWKNFTLEIPESNNDLSDLLDEIKWEMDWLLKMQNEDGSFLHLLGVDVSSGKYWSTYVGCPASEDKEIRRYEGKSGQATGAAFSMVAASSYYFANEKTGETSSKKYLKASLKAWDWIQNNPGKLKSAPKNARFLGSSNGFLGFYGKQKTAILEGLVFIHLQVPKAITMESVLKHYNAMKKSEFISVLLWQYTHLAKADKKIRGAIQLAYKNAFEYDINSNAYGDPFSSTTWWGNNGNICARAYQVSLVKGLFDQAKQNHSQYFISGALSYIHGTNPLGTAYLTNLSKYGVTQSLSKFYHGDSNLASDPPPAFIVGGPNFGFTGKSRAIKGRAPQKAFDLSFQAKPVYEYLEGQVALQASYCALLFSCILEAQ